MNNQTPFLRGIDVLFSRLKQSSIVWPEKMGNGVVRMCGYAMWHIGDVNGRWECKRPQHVDVVPRALSP